MLFTLANENSQFIKLKKLPRIATLEYSISRNDRCPRTRSKELQQVQDPEQGYKAGNACAEVSL